MKRIATKAIYGFLLSTCMTVASPKYARAEACKALFRNFEFSRFAIDPTLAVVGTFPHKITDADILGELEMLKPFGGHSRVIRRQLWDEVDSPISSKVRDFFYQNEQFVKDTQEKPFIVELRIQYFKTGDYAGGISTNGFHIDNSNSITSGRKPKIYIFNLSPGDEVIAPTEFYAGPEYENLFTKVQDAGNHLSVFLPKNIVSDFTYEMKNGELIRMFGDTLHRRTSAIQRGYRYFIRIVLD